MRMDVSTMFYIVDTAFLLCRPELSVCPPQHNEHDTSPHNASLDPRVFSFILTTTVSDPIIKSAFCASWN